MTNVETHRKSSDALRTFPVVLLLTAGFIKGSPLFGWLPVDLTLLAAALVGVAAVAELRENPRTPAGWGPLVWMTVAFMLPVLVSSSIGYGVDKARFLFLLTLPATFCACIIVNTPERMWWVARWTAFAGLLMALLLGLSPSSVELYGRLASEGANTTSLGRGCGAAIVAAVALGVGGKWRWPVVLMVSAGLALIVVGSGARGPLLATGAAVIATAVFQPGLRKIKYLAGLFWLTTIAAPFVILTANPTAVSRIALLFAADRGESISVREELFSLAIEVGNQNFLGVGWGGFARYDSVLLYPHNVLLEVYAEAGWIAALSLALVIAASVMRLVKVRHVPAMTATFGLLVFWFVNAMVSGNVNDNRAMFALVAIGLTLPRVLLPREGLVVSIGQEIRRSPPPD